MAEEHLFDTSKVSAQSRQRAQVMLNEAKEREADFRARCDRLRRVLADISSIGDLNAALDELESAEEHFWRDF